MPVGLHVRLPDRRVSNDDRIERTWVYWSVSTHVGLPQYSFHSLLISSPQDKLWSLFVGRNQSLPTEHVETYPPPIDFRMDNDLWEWAAPDSRFISQKAQLSSTFAEEVKLMCFASGIMNAIYDEHFVWKVASKIDDVQDIW